MTREAVQILVEALVAEMNRRYELFKEAKVPISTHIARLWQTASDALDHP